MKKNIANDGLTKQQRYRQNKRRSGCCPHCGRPCAPFYYCAERRKEKAQKMAVVKPGTRLDMATGGNGSALYDIIKSSSPSPLQILIAKEEAAEKQKLFCSRSEFSDWISRNGALLSLGDVFLHIEAQEVILV